jgi:outer membrane protein assembly factor BamB
MFPEKGNGVKKGISLCIFMGCLACGCIVQYHNVEWPLFMYDPQHTGYSPSGMPGSLSLLWESKEFDSYISHVIVSEGRVIAVLGPRHVISLDITDGSLQWDVGGDFAAYPAAGKGRIFVGVHDGILCLDSVTGNLLWKYEDEDLRYVSSPPIIVGDHLFVGTGCEFFQLVDSYSDTARDPFEAQERMLCINVESGEIIWEFRGKETISDSPAYFDGRVFICEGSNIDCLNADTGELIWEKDVEVGYHLCLSDDGKKLFLESYVGALECLNSDNGESLWQFDCGSSITLPIAVGYGHVFCGSEDGVLSCVDSDRGDLIWKRELGNFPSAVASRQVNILILADKNVAVAAGKTLYILDARSGKTIESYTVETRIESIALSDGKLIASEGTGRILCMGSSQNPTYPVLVFILAIAAITVLLILVRKKGGIVQRKE